MLARPTPAFVNAMVNAFYQLPGNICGGILHAVLDDGNLETHHVAWAREDAVEKNDLDAVFLADVLLQFSEDEREEIFATDFD